MQKRAALWMGRMLLACLIVFCSFTAEAAHRTKRHHLRHTLIHHTSWLEQSKMTGDWGGLRSRLADNGFLFNMDHSLQFWGNSVGGLGKGVGFEWFFELGFDLDLQKLMSIDDAILHVCIHNYLATPFSDKYVGMFGPTAADGFEASNSIRFYEIFVEKHFGKRTSRLKIGQLAADSDFMVSTTAAVLFNGGFGDMPLQAANMPGIPVYPLAAPGLVIGLDSSLWFLTAGLYLNQMNVDDSWKNFGFAWAKTDVLGPAVLLEVGVHPFEKTTPGRYTFGVYAADGPEVDTSVTPYTLTDPRSTYGLYVMMEQQLFHMRHGKRKLDMFFRGAVAPNMAHSVMGWYIDGGLLFTGLVSGKGHDALGFGFSVGKLSQNFLAVQPTPKHQTQAIFELTYQYRLGGWWTIQPDIQWIYHPTDASRNALLVGMRTVFNL